MLYYNISDREVYTLTLKEYLASLRGKRVTVIGAGLSNRPLIGLLAEAGVETTVCDRSDADALGGFYEDMCAKGVGFHLGESYLDGLGGDVIFRTPSVLPTRPELAAAAADGVVVTSEMEVFMALCPCQVIAVTGSDGKTTTTTLIARMQEAAGRKVWLGGNIGHPLLAEVDGMGPEDVAVLELSSFQLHSMNCSPDVAVITNIAPNHLDIHRDYQDYIDAKKQIFLHQRQNARLVLNRDNEVTCACMGEANSFLWWFSRRESVSPGVYLGPDGVIRARLAGGEEIAVMAADEIRIPGMHNVENVMCAMAAVWGLVPAPVMARVAREFPGVAHRLETVRVLRGVTYINDSIASSPDRTCAGLACFPEKVILIAGGKDKGVPFDKLGPAVCRHVKKLFLTGLTAGKIEQAVKNAPEYRPGAPEIFVLEDFAETVRAAAAAAAPGDTVLLSPASTSFDRFKNFEQRGETFRHIVEEME